MDNIGGICYMGWRLPGGSETLLARHIIILRRGVLPGNPLDPLLRTLALHPFVLALQTQFPDARIMSIPEDTKVIGSRMSVVNIFKKLGRRLRISL